MFIPQPPHSPDEHHRWARAEQERHATEAESRRKLGLGGRSILSMGDVLIIGGTIVVAVLALGLFFGLFSGFF